jgi:preprotein translocase subunit SecD
MNISARSLATSPFIWWVIVAIVGIVYLFKFDGGAIKLRDNRLSFGIDLVGGSYITLGVQTEKAVEAELIDKMQSLKKRLAENSLPQAESFVVENQKIVGTFASSQEVAAVMQELGSDDRQIIYSSEGNKLIISLKEAVVERITKEAIQGNIHVLRSRLDAFGVGEVAIAAQGDKNIVVELPNVEDPVQAERIIGKVALLEIKAVERTGSSREELLDAYDGELPYGLDILPGKENADSYGKEYFLVQKFTDLTGRSLKHASMGFGDARSGVVVNFEFSPEGGEKFYELTRKNIGRRLAIILDGIVISAPVVNSAIKNKGIIQGNFTTKSATELAMLLKSGAFVAPVTFEERRQIGPSLGQESIHQGILACFVGLVLLAVFGVVTYKTAGLFAVVALLYNLLLIMIILSFFKATLTLPGIAGMVLTVGMAIDASILIYERMREELAMGVGSYKAMLNGFSDAMVVILDSNITTFIIGAVLYWFGTGPIQGFAITMMIGIVATLITGLFFLRSLFTFVFRDLGIQSIRI